VDCCVQWAGKGKKAGDRKAVARSNDVIRKLSKGPSRQATSDQQQQPERRKVQKGRSTMEQVTAVRARSKLQKGSSANSQIVSETAAGARTAVRGALGIPNQPPATKNEGTGRLRCWQVQVWAMSDGRWATLGCFFGFCFLLAIIRPGPGPPSWVPHGAPSIGNPARFQNEFLAGIVGPLWIRDPTG